jgi:hypothetical protein
MLLVPRQLLRSGMTGSVPYYGGRFTPAQAWAAAHPAAPRVVASTSAPGVATGRAPLPPTSTTPQAPDEDDTRAALRYLRDSGVLTSEEYSDLLMRTDQ